MNFLNFLLIVLVLLGFLIGTLVYFRPLGQGVKAKHKNKVLVDNDQYQFETIVAYVKEAINDITRSNLYELGLSEESFKRRINKRSALKSALKNCTYGSILDKEYVKDFIRDLLIHGYIDETNVDKIMHFNQANFLSIQDKFDILIYSYKKVHAYDGLSHLIEAYDLDHLKNLIEDGETASYIITADEIISIYNHQSIHLSFEDKLAIITQRVYQMYKGFGVVDELRDMAIDGISGGVSGVVERSNDTTLDNYLNQISHIPNNYDSVWIFYKGKSVHLSFLSFGSEKELRRICQNIYRYNKAGQLSENSGFKVNEMQDGSRVVVVRPGFSESWAFFVRKFHIATVTLEELITDENCQLPIETLKYLIKGARITSVTGSQGSGKTTLLMAMVRNIYATLTLRVQEMAFELHLRNVYPMRNILTFKETPTISGQAGMDVQKKTDGSVNILGEIATDEVAVWMLQMAQVASLFTLFTHHAKTVKDLVLSLRNSLLKCDVFRDEKIAEQQVVNVLDFDIHLERDSTGKRYISRVTEIIELDQEKPYAINYQQMDRLDDQVRSFMDTMTDYFTRQTDRKIYESRNIIEFKEGRYVSAHLISEKTILSMEQHMTPIDYSLFLRFIKENWSGVI
jgi:pilus assembly protein CpaF